jgi:PhnB protein
MKWIMEVSPYLVFDGNCSEAFNFYEKVLGGKIVFIQTFADSPEGDKMPPEWRNRIIHVRLESSGQALMGSDAPPQHFQKPQGFSVSVSVKAVSDAERIFKALSEDGTTQMPFGKTFWSPGFGMLVDRFGIPWMVNSEAA